MGIYAELMERSDVCGRLALEYRAKGEVDLALFWYNASIGYKNRALNLCI